MAGAFDQNAFAETAFSVTAFDFGTVTPLPPVIVPPQGPGQRGTFRQQSHKDLRWTPPQAADRRAAQQRHEPTPSITPAESHETLAFLFAAFEAVDDFA